MQNDKAEGAREELESRRRRAALLEQIKADTEAKLAGVQAKLGQLSGGTGDDAKFHLEKFLKLVRHIVHMLLCAQCATHADAVRSM